MRRSVTKPRFLWPRVSRVTLLAVSGRSVVRGLTRPLACVVAGLAPLGSIAAPLDPGLVHTDAAWVVHLDNEALNATALSARVRALDIAAAEEGDREFRASFGIDPTTDLFGLTIYGGDQGPEEGVVIADVRAQAAEALPRFLESKRLAGLTQVTDAGRTFHQWTLEGRPFVMLIAAGSHEDRRRVILGPSIQSIQRAARVAEGELASQRALREPTLPLEPSQNASLFISVRGAGSGEAGDARAALFRSARSITVEMGEKRVGPPGQAPAAPVASGASPSDAANAAASGPAATGPAAVPQVYLDIRLDAGNEQTATQLSQVAQGLASFARLQVAEQKDLTQVVDMLDQVKVSVEANLVRVQASSQTEAFAQILVNPQVEAYVRSLVPIGGGVPLSGANGTKPPANAVQPASNPAPASSSPSKPGASNEEGVR